MAKFATRVELYGTPGLEIYQLLHECMAAANFTNRVTFCGILYSLPEAEYIREGTETIKTIEALAVQAVLPVWKDFGVMVTKTEDEIGFHNLKPVNLYQEAK